MKASPSSARRLFARASLAAAIVTSGVVAACGWDPSRPFERESPQVREAIGHLDGGDAGHARDLLADYLATGACSEGSIGTPPRVKERSNGSFDLGLALFKIAEAYGRRFGEEEVDAGPLGDKLDKGPRAENVECALKIVRAVATDPDQPVDLRARSRYLEGNLLFLNANYEEAVRAYDAALELAPGMTDAGPLGASDASKYAPDPVGRDAAWNRSIALRRIEDKKDAGTDAQNDSPSEGGDGGGDGGGNKGNDGGSDGGGGKDGGKDASNDAGGKDDKQSPDDEKNKPPQPKPDEGKDAGPPPPSRQNQDERMLDQLENAPTVQQEAARKQGRARKVRGMADK
jgi:uncharacterized membrane protein YgcG